MGQTPIPIPRRLSKSVTMIPKKLGSVYNNYSNYLVTLVADGKAARGWKADSHPEFESLNELCVAEKKARVRLAGEEGVLVSIGDCGMSDVFQLGKNDFVLPEHYPDDWNPDIEARFLNTISQPLGKKAKTFGHVEIRSGLLALLHAGDPAEDLPKKLKRGQTQEVEGGLVIGVPNGRYEIFKETLREKGGFGEIASRLRIVAVNSSKKAHTKASFIPALAHSKTSPADVQLYACPKGMQFIEELALSSDGAWLVAGEKGGVRVAVWSTETGKLRWFKSLTQARSASRYWQNTHISIYQNHLMAAVSGTAAASWTMAKAPAAPDTPGKLGIFDLKTGAAQAEHSLSEQISMACFNSNGESVLIGHAPNVHVVDWRTGKVLHTIEGYCGGAESAPINPNGKTMLIAGAQLHVCDPSTFAILKTLKHRLRRPVFSSDGKSIAGESDNGAVEIWDSTIAHKQSNLTRPSHVHATRIGDIAWRPDGKYLAVAYEDGYVRIWKVAQKKIVLEFPGHDTTIPDTGARSLKGLTWNPNGTILYVGGARKGTYGISAYRIRRMS